MNKHSKRSVGASRGKGISRRLRLEQLESRALLSAVPFGAAPEDTSEFMIGTVHVTVALFESDGTIDPSTEDWTALQISEVKTKIQQGLDWWEETLALKGSAHTVDFAIDFTYADSPISTPYEPISRPSSDQGLWVDSFLDVVGYNTSAGYRDDMDAFNHQQRLDAGTNWAFTIFITHSANDADGLYADGANAWAYAGGPYTMIQYHRSRTTVAHEVGHIFYALDEYENGRSYYDHRGYYNTQNLNAFDDHPDPASRVPSIMGGISGYDVFGDHLLSTSAEEMLGWKDSDGDGFFDLLDVPLALTGVGQFDPLTRLYEFQGTSSVQTLPNLNPSGSGNDITIHVVDRVQYRLDGGPWIDLETYQSYDAVIDVEIGPLPAGSHQVEIRTVSNVAGITSAIFAGSTDHASMVTSEGINGFIWRDFNADSAWQETEFGLGGWEVALLDAGMDPVTFLDGIEPDDYDPGDILNTVNPTVTLRSVGPAVETDLVGVMARSSASTGTELFANQYAGGGGEWNSLWRDNYRQLRVDFNVPVDTFSIDIIGYSEGSAGRVRIYSAAGSLLWTYESDQLVYGEVATMTPFRAQGDIAYAIIDSSNVLSVRLDNLRFPTAVRAVTGAGGEYTLRSVPPSSYFVQAIPPAGWRMTSPPDGIRSVSVATEGQVVEGVNFGAKASLPGDANSDGVVNSEDAAILAAHWGMSRLSLGDGDFNGDRMANAIDAAIMAANWGATYVPMAEGTVLDGTIGNDVPFIGPLLTGEPLSGRRLIAPVSRRQESRLVESDVFSARDYSETDTAASCDACLAEEYGPAVDRARIVWVCPLAKREPLGHQAPQAGSASEGGGDPAVDRRDGQVHRLGLSADSR